MQTNGPQKCPGCDRSSTSSREDGLCYICVGVGRELDDFRKELKDAKAKTANWRNEHDTLHYWLREYLKERGQLDEFVEYYMEHRDDT